MNQIRKRFEIPVIALVMALLVLLPIMGMPEGARGAPVQTAITKDYRLLFASAARGTTTSSAFETYDANAMVAWLTVTAKSGGATALDCKFQDSVDGTAYSDLPGGAFTQVTASTGAQRITVQAPPGRYVQCVATVAGSSTPTFTFHVEVMFAKFGGAINISTAADASILTGTLATARLNEDVARTVQVTIPTASVLALFTTPYTLIAAPGAGKINLVDEITVKLVFNSIAYTGANALEFRYTDGSGAKVSADVAAAFINSASGTNYVSVKGVVTSLTPVANAAVVAAVPTANPGAGNSALVVSIKYRVVTP